MSTPSQSVLIRLPGVRSGHTIVSGTRIGVHDVVGLVVTGASVDDVLRSFPELTPPQVHACLDYYEVNRSEIDALVAVQRAPGGQ